MVIPHAAQSIPVVSFDMPCVIPEVFEKQRHALGRRSPAAFECIEAEDPSKAPYGYLLSAPPVRPKLRRVSFYPRLNMVPEPLGITLIAG